MKCNFYSGIGARITPPHTVATATTSAQIRVFYAMVHKYTTLAFFFEIYPFLPLFFINERRPYGSVLFLRTAAAGSLSHGTSVHSAQFSVLRTADCVSASSQDVTRSAWSSAEIKKFFRRCVILRLLLCLIRGRFALFHVIIKPLQALRSAGVTSQRLVFSF